MYRIIEEKTTVTKKSKFYIQKKIRFLFLEWWSKLKMYHPVFDVELDYDYDTYEDAKKRLRQDKRQDRRTGSVALLVTFCVYKKWRILKPKLSEITKLN